MTPLKLLKLLKAQKIHLWVEDERLKYTAPKGALTKELRREIQDSKAELLEFLCPAIDSEAESSETISGVARSDDLQLSFSQLRMWFLDQFHPGKATYNIPVGLQIDGELSVSALSDSISALQQRHEVLRTRFPSREGRPSIVISPDSDVSLRHQDLRELPADIRETKYRQIAAEFMAKPFDLAAGPLFRVLLLKLDDSRHVFLLCIHHIIFDGWSLEVFFRDLSRLYHSFVQGKVPDLCGSPLQYVDFAKWQRDSLRGQSLQRSMNFWRNELLGDLPILQLPTDRPRPPVKRHRGGVVEQTFSVETMQSLRGLSKDAESSLFMTLLAAYVVFLRRHTGQRDLTVGTPVAGRERAETHDMIGFFVNTLVLRFETDGSQSFLDLLQHIKEVSLNALEHQDVPFEKLVDELQPSRNLDRTPFFSTMFTFHQSVQASTSFEGLKLSRIPLTTPTSKFDLTLSFFESDDELGLSVEYDSDLFEAETVRRFLSQMRVLLEGVCEDPKCAIEELPLLPECERRELLIDRNSTQIEFPSNKCVHQLVEVQAQKTPDAIAVISEGEQLSYRELNERSNQVAHRLLELGVQPDSLVGLCLGRSANLLVGILGILKAGGAYVPLDINNPAERQRYILDDANVKLLVTERDLLDQLNASERTTVCVDAGQSAIDRQPNCNPDTKCLPKHLAYVMYTSGTTGRPKGVAIEHRSIVRLVCGNQYATFGPDRTFLQLATISFDASTFEIWGALLHGAKLVVAPSGLVDLRELNHLLDKYKVTTLWLTATLFNQIIDQSPTILQHVEEILTGGEALSVKHVRDAQLILGPKVRLINGYGPTESTTFTTCYPIPHGVEDGIGSIPIGRPISNTQVYVLDGQRRLVSIGVPGELYIGGCGLARGYLNQPELTAEKFIDHPFSDEPGARLYRTGDLVRWRSDGTLEFIGRLDNQVKLRGFRIELGEIESVLGKHPLVRQSIAIIREDNPGEKYVVAYYVPIPESNASPDLLRKSLKATLPDYMIPSHFVQMETLPLTVNGKVDRKSLPAPKPSVLGEKNAKCQEPQSYIERKLADIWQSLLNCDTIGAEDPFFEIGGHSLLAARLVSEIRKQLACEISIADVYQASTIRSMAARIECGDWKPPHESLVPYQTQGQKSPLFCLHGMTGLAMEYHNLARQKHLDRPMYGVKALEPNSELRQHHSVEEMARYYVREIQTVQPQGPYHLTGYSIGGWYAYAVAQEFYRQGQEVSTLLLVDTHANVKLSWKLFLRSKAWMLVRRGFFHLRSLMTRSKGERSKYLAGRWRALLNHLPGSNRRETRTNEVEASSEIDPTKPIPYLVDAIKHYQPPSYAGNLQIFVGDDRDYVFPHRLFWSGLIKGEIQIHKVKGDHLSLLNEENAEDFANLLSQVLDQSEAK